MDQSVGDGESYSSMGVPVNSTGAWGAVAFNKSAILDLLSLVFLDSSSMRCFSAGKSSINMDLPFY